MFSKNINIIQVNLNRSLPATESVLQLAVEFNTSIIAVQEPCIVNSRELNRLNDYSEARSINHPGFIQVLPLHGKLRPRTMFYINRDCSLLTSISPSSPADPDCLLLDISEGNKKVQLINIYNQGGLGVNKEKTVSRFLYDYHPTLEYILLGDFNLHHPWWDPYNSPASVTESDDFAAWLESKDLFLVNKIGQGTFIRPDLQAPSVLDLTFSSNRLVNDIKDWTIVPSIGSDHLAICFCIKGEGETLVDSPTSLPRFKIDQADWGLFSSELKERLKSQSSLLDLVKSNLDQFDKKLSLKLIQDQFCQEALRFDRAASELTSIIFESAKTSIPTSKLGAKSKPWWSPELKLLRKSMMKAQREMVKHASPCTKQEYLKAKNSYFCKIKQAKKDHWNQFLEKEDCESIFKALSYTKDKKIEKIPPLKPSLLSNDLVDSFELKAKAFTETLFPSPPVTPSPDYNRYKPSDQWSWVPLTEIELKSACSTKIKGKTPGPDQISQQIIQKAYSIIPDVFFKLYSSLINTGYHPKCWKEATGAILKKPQKPDYSSPKAYRVISLLNCLGKVSERILARRLGYLAETTVLLHPSQLGGRLKKSAIDTALLLVNEVELGKRNNRLTSTLFLDVKGAFDHVSKNRLLSILIELRLPSSLVSWVFAFLSDRLLRLSFDGQVEAFKLIITGIPQGSPISPILFLIYIRDLFKSRAIKYLSYIDDISLSYTSTSLRKNIKLLEDEVHKLFNLAKDNAIEFDLSKTELIHWTNTKDSELCPVTLPDKTQVPSKNVVKWLGITFDSRLSFKEHVIKRTSQAKSIFHRIERLANTERGLSPFAVRQLYNACITSIADYGSIIWWRGQKSLLKFVQGLQNKSLRKILGVFRSAPILPMEIEAALPPASVRLNNSIRKYALRTLKLSERHPINVAIAQLPRVRTVHSPVSGSDFDPQSEPGSEPESRTDFGSEDSYTDSQGSEDSQISNSIDKPVQLHRIKDSIKDLYNKFDLEDIKPFYFPPWERRTPYEVTISKLNKEDQAIQHNLQIQRYQNTDLVLIYTDASSMPRSSGIGVGLVAFDYSQSQDPIYQDRKNIGQGALVYNGELEGITMAIEYASKIAVHGQGIYIYSDNQAGLNRLKTPSDNPGQSCQIRAVLAGREIEKKGASLSLEWVPGHKEVVGNELVDKLAKAASYQYPDLEQDSFALLGVKIKQRTRAEWIDILDLYRKGNTQNKRSYSNQFSLNPKSEISIPLNTKREVASAFFQLKLGHGYIKSYLKRLGHSESDECRCGGKETPEHLILWCTLYWSERNKLKKSLNCPLNLKVLFETKVGIEHLLVFLKETSICTRRWHLARAEDPDLDPFTD